jgi:hypothetical protein
MWKLSFTIRDGNEIVRTGSKDTFNGTGSVIRCNHHDRHSMSVLANTRHCTFRGLNREFCND